MRDYDDVVFSVIGRGGKGREDGLGWGTEGWEVRLVIFGFGIDVLRSYFISHLHHRHQLHRPISHLYLPRPVLTLLPVSAS